MSTLFGLLGRARTDDFRWDVGVVPGSARRRDGLAGGSLQRVVAVGSAVRITPATQQCNEFPELGENSTG